MGFLYKLTYKVSRKAYIGQTSRPILERLAEHQLASSGCRAISGAIKKHGWENFDKEWYEVPDDELNFYEEMLVALLGTLAPGGYNLKEGGGATGKMGNETKQKMSESKTGEKNPMYGKEHTEETKKKMSGALSGEKAFWYGKTLSNDTKQKLSEAKSGEKNHMYGKTGEKNPNYGKTHTAESKEKISKAHTGKTLSKETKEKMSEVHTGKTHTAESKKKMSEAKTGENHPKSKKVYQYNLDGTFVDDFDSTGEAARALGKKKGTLISKCARGERKDAYGFKWSYTVL